MEALEVEGIATHLSSADEPENPDHSAYTSLQIDKFKGAINDAKTAGFDIPLRHAANSAGIFNFPGALFNMARPGIMLYGAYPSPSVKRIGKLKPVLTFKTGIVELRDIERGARVSYAGAYEAPSERRIAVLPVGYADGYCRGLSGNAEVLVRGVRAPVIGRVCMDMTIIDVTDIASVEIGDEVILIGVDQGDRISADEIAEKLQTIPYEVFCGISNRVPRTYIRNNTGNYVFH